MIKANWYVYTDDGSECQLCINHFYETPHSSYVDKLNCDGYKIRAPLPEKRMKTLPNVYEILPNQYRLIINYLILRRFDANFIPGPRFIFFPTLGKRFKNELLNNY